MLTPMPDRIPSSGQDTGISHAPRTCVGLGLLGTASATTESHPVPEPVRAGRSDNSLLIACRSDPRNDPTSRSVIRSKRKSIGVVEVAVWTRIGYLRTTGRAPRQKIHELDR